MPADTAVTSKDQTTDTQNPLSSSGDFENLSCLYEGSVRHRRNFPVHHEFDFNLFLFWLDLDHLEKTFARNIFYSSKRWAFARFRESEHLTKYSDGVRSLRERVSVALCDQGIEQYPARVLLLTQLRYLGFGMNPISLYYCYDECENLFAIIAEVNNTPWGEQHLYVLEQKSKENSKGMSSDEIAKTFHVSPFMALDMFYKMKFSLPGEKLAAKIENHITENHHEIEKGEFTSDRILDVTMSLARVELTPAKLNWFLIKYPLISFKIFLGIYWQAFCLFFIRRIRFYSHPGKQIDPTQSSSTDPVDSSVPVKPSCVSSSQVGTEEMLVRQ